MLNSFKASLHSVANGDAILFYDCMVIHQCTKITEHKDFKFKITKSKSKSTTNAMNFKNSLLTSEDVHTHIHISTSPKRISGGLRHLTNRPYRTGTALRPHREHRHRRRRHPTSHITCAFFLHSLRLRSCKLARDEWLLCLCARHCLSPLHMWHHVPRAVPHDRI